MQDEKTYTIAVTESELDIIGTALVEMPYRVVFGLVAKLQAQMIAQNLPQADPAQGEATTTTPEPQLTTPELQPTTPEPVQSPCNGAQCCGGCSVE